MNEIDLNQLLQKLQQDLPLEEAERNYLLAQLQRQAIGLHWEEKEESPSTAIRLAEIEEKRVGKTGPEHWLIEGDNLEGLQLLQAQWKQKVDIIYIDPPYNTGNRDFKYNDHYVDQDDAYRHSKWLSFMAARLKLAKSLLKEDGAIFISIDDAEHARLKLLCDNIFGAQNFIANFIRKNKVGSGHDSKKVAVEFDYMLCYAANQELVTFSKEKVNVRQDSKYRYTDNYQKKRGKYYLRDLDYKGSYSPTLDYAISAPDGTPLWPGGEEGKPNTWRWSEEKVKWGIENDFIVFKQRADKWKVYIKQYQFVDNNDRKRQRQLPYRAMIDFSNAKGSNLLKSILQQDTFTYPKPVELIQFVIGLFADRQSAVILDFFAGSGTSLHATLLQNEKDGGQRSCILITNNENRICEEVTYPRCQKVIEGYQNRNRKAIKGLSKNQLRYFRIEED